MITNFKIFENNNDNIEVGDYVIFYYGGNYDEYNDGLAKFINSNVGKIVSFKPFDSFEIIYENSYKGKNTFILSQKFVIFHSKSKEDCEQYFAIKKYNL